MGRMATAETFGYDARLQHPRSELDHRAHRIDVGDRRVRAVERNTGPYQIEVR